jgi:hypothetical protein
MENLIKENLFWIGIAGGWVGLGILARLIRLARNGESKVGWIKYILFGPIALLVVICYRRDDEG